MPTTKTSKWQRNKKPVCHKFSNAVEGTREQTEQFWESLSLPKHKKTQRKPKPVMQKGSHNTINAKLKALAYRQAEDRDDNMCIVCGGQAHQHHHIIRQSTRYGPGYIQRMENIACICVVCHTMGPESIHGSKGKSAKQTFLELWQQKYYPEYVAMMRELAKITGCKDDWLIERWHTKYADKTMC